MKSSLVCISGVRGYEEDGVAYLHIEDSARGLGLKGLKLKMVSSTLRFDGRLSRVI